MRWWGCGGCDGGDLKLNDFEGGRAATASAWQSEVEIGMLHSRVRPANEPRTYGNDNEGNQK